MSVIQSVRGNEHDLQLAINGRERLRQQYTAFVEHLNEAQIRLQQRYREANLRTRTTPFPRRWLVATASIKAVDVDLTSADLSASHEATRHVIERMEFFIRAINEEYDSQATRYPPIGDLLEPRRFSESMNV